ncbi:MAG: sugar kinase, partial [Bacteroidota bacterium]
MRKVVTFGEIMLGLSPPGYARFMQAHSFEATYSGCEANVAISLSHFGLFTEFVTRLPDDDLGKAVISELRRHNVGVDHIIRGGDRLGLYFFEKGAVSRGGQVIYDRANSAIAQIQPGMIDWEHVLDGCNWFHWSGITPGISQSAAAVTLEAIEVAHELRIPISVDFNYRS